MGIEILTRPITGVMVVLLITTAVVLGRPALPKAKKKKRSSEAVQEAQAVLGTNDAEQRLINMMSKLESMAKKHHNLFKH